MGMSVTCSQTQRILVNPYSERPVIHHFSRSFDQTIRATTNFSFDHKLSYASISYRPGLLSWSGRTGATRYAQVTRSAVGAH